MNYKEKILASSFMDDDFMSYALNHNIPCIEKIIQIVLNRKDIKIKDCKTQNTIPYLKHGIRLDCIAYDENDIVYNIEIQKVLNDFIPQRMRYYSSMLDMELLDKGSDYEELPETFIIFLVQGDFHERVKPIYHFEMRESEDFFIEGDGHHHLYANVEHEFKDDNEMKILFHDLLCTNGNEMIYDCFRETMNTIKQDDKEVDKMAVYMKSSYQEGYDNGVQSGILQGQYQLRNTQIHMILSLNQNQYPIDKISKAVNLSEQEVLTIIQENSSKQK